MPEESARNIAGDIEYMRTLAERGVQAPLLGGRFSLMWGVLVTLATLIEWLILSNRISWGADKIGLVWLAIGVLGGILSFILGRSLRGKPGCGSVGNRVSQIVWSAGGIAIFVYVMSLVAGAVFGKTTAGDFDTIMPMAFCIYGTAYFTTGSLSGNGAMKIIAMLAFAGALITSVLIHQPAAYLVAAIFVVLTAIIPGLMLMRAEPAQIV